MKRIITLVLASFLLLINNFEIKAQPNDKLKAHWIIQNFAPNVIWSNEHEIESFLIGVYGNDTNIYKQLADISKRLKIKGKPFKIVMFKQLKDIVPTHILFIEESVNPQIEKIYKKVEYNTLIITDNSPASSFSAINLLDLIKERKKFEINKKIASEFGIKFNKALLLHGGGENK